MANAKEVIERIAEWLDARNKEVAQRPAWDDELYGYGYDISAYDSDEIKTSRLLVDSKMQKAQDTLDEYVAIKAQEAIAQLIAEAQEPQKPRGHPLYPERDGRD
jgi:hypothetical protein